MRRLIPLLFLIALAPVVFAAYTFYPTHFFDTGGVIYSFQSPTTVSTLQYGNGYLLLNGSVNYSFTVPSGTKAYINLSTPALGESQAIATLKDSGEYITLPPFTLYFNSSKDEGTLMPVWNSSAITLNYSLADADWVEVNYSLNGGTPTTLSSETAVVSQTQWDATQNVSTWNGVAFNATESYYLRKAHLYFTVAGTFNVTILDSNLNILDSVVVTTAAGDTEIGGWQNVEFTSGSTYYLLANTSIDSNLAYMSSDVLADACWANSTDLTSVTLDCTKDTYFKLIKLTYTNATLSPVDGYNNVTLTAKDSAGNTYSLLWEFINANKTLYSNLWHTIYASGAIERERIFQNDSFDNYVNISDTVSVAVSNGSVRFYATVPQTNTMFFNLSGDGNNITITVTGTAANSVWLRYRNGTRDGSVTVRADGVFNDTISLSSAEINYTRAPLVENLTLLPSSIYQGESITVTVDVVESVGSITSVILSDLLTGRNFTMNLSSGNTYSVYIEGSAFQQPGSHTMKVYATNDAGYTNDIVSSVLTVQQSSGSLGGGGGGLGAPLAIEPTKKWCAKLGGYIEEEKWSEELCAVEAVPKVREAQIIYFVTNFYKKNYCSAVRGKAPFVDCKEDEVEVGDTIYVEGYAYSTGGVVFPESYSWTLKDSSNRTVATFSGRSISFSMRDVGDYLLLLVVFDTQNYTYLANYSFRVVESTSSEGFDLGEVLSLLGKVKGESNESANASEKNESGVNLPLPSLPPPSEVKEKLSSEQGRKKVGVILLSVIFSAGLMYRMFFRPPKNKG